MFVPGGWCWSPGGSACPQSHHPPAPPGPVPCSPAHSPCPSLSQSALQVPGVPKNVLGAAPAPVWMHGSASTLQNGARCCRAALCCQALPAAILGGGHPSCRGLTGVSPVFAAALRPHGAPRSAEASPGRASLLREDDLAVRSLSSPATGEPPRPRGELHLPCRQCIPTPSHQANLIKLPPNLCAKVGRNARAVFHKKYESKRSRARKVSGRGPSRRAGSACLQREQPSPQRAPPPPPRGDGSFGRGRPSAARHDGLGEPGLPLLPYLPSN